MLLKFKNFPEIYLSTRVLNLAFFDNFAMIPLACDYSSSRIFQFSLAMKEIFEKASSVLCAVFKPN